MKRESFEDVLARLSGIECPHRRVNAVRLILCNEKDRERKYLSSPQKDQLRLLFIKSRLAVIKQRKKAGAA